MFIMTSSTNVLRLVFAFVMANTVVCGRNKFDSIKIHLFHKKSVLIYKKVQQKVPSMNFVKNRRRGQAGGDTFLQMHNFIENGRIQICATKKCLT